MFVSQLCLYQFQAFHLRHILESLPRFANSFTVFTLVPSYELATLYPDDLDLNAMLTMDTLSTISKICSVSSINNDRESLLSALHNVRCIQNEWSITVSLAFSVEVQLLFYSRKGPRSCIWMNCLKERNVKLVWNE